MFKSGDKVNLSSKGVSIYSQDDWNGYPIPYKIFKHGGVVSRVEFPSDDGPRVYVKSNDGGGTVYFNEDELEIQSIVPGSLTKELVNRPKHYELFEDVEAIEVISRSLTKEEFRGYCFGNLLKYRLRCGKKDNVEQELAKADKYKELYENYKDFCYE